jgi:hypothetical protein
MPRGPKGEKRPADVIGNAVKVMRIAVGDEHEGDGTSPAKAARALKGGLARSARLDKSQRSEVAKKAAKARWGK